MYEASPATTSESLESPAPAAAMIAYVCIERKIQKILTLHTIRWRRTKSDRCVVYYGGRWKCFVV